MRLEHRGRAAPLAAPRTPRRAETPPSRVRLRRRRRGRRCRSAASASPRRRPHRLVRLSGGAALTSAALDPARRPWAMPQAARRPRRRRRRQRRGVGDGGRAAWRSARLLRRLAVAVKRGAKTTAERAQRVDDRFGGGPRRTRCDRRAPPPTPRWCASAAASAACKIDRRACAAGSASGACTRQRVHGALEGPGRVGGRRRENARHCLVLVVRCSRRTRRSIVGAGASAASRGHVQRRRRNRAIPAVVEAVRRTRAVGLARGHGAFAASERWAKDVSSAVVASSRARARAGWRLPHGLARWQLFCSLQRGF